ncbi:MAG: hypothetical protein V4620_01675 [Bacteroidota bacterium]
MNNNKLKSFIDKYENGEESFFHFGEVFKLNDGITKVIVFDLAKTDSSIDNLDYIKKDVRKRMIYTHQSFEDASIGYGNNVTSKFILNPYGFKKTQKPINSNFEEYVNSSRIEELSNSNSNEFDLTKLIRLCEELNIAYYQGLYFAVGTLVRALLDHISPIFKQTNFSGVANQYKAKGQEKSFKESMEQLDKSMRKIVDNILHSQITESETLPNKTQVDCRRDLDRLLEEIVRILKVS